MKRKKVCLVINPRAGHNCAKLNDFLPVLSAARWKTDIRIKEYGGHAIELASRAAKEKYDLIVSYGGDGTFNQVINGVLNKKGCKSAVGLIPGGTANVWAGEVGIPSDATRAVLSLVNSDVRETDVVRVHVSSLSFPLAENQAGRSAAKKGASKTAPRRKVSNNGRPSLRTRKHFLLMAGLGMDAAILEHVAKPLKYEIGRLAVGFAAVKELAVHQPFLTEIGLANSGQVADIVWKGDALQVVVGNTRHYGIGQITPNAYVDDGLLDVCVITAGHRAVPTFRQVFSLLAVGKPDKAGAEYFRAAHFSISVPASIGMQLDGSTVDLKDYLSKANWRAVQQVENPARVMVNYRFDVLPHQLPVAIPCTYDNSLFKNGSAEAKSRLAVDSRKMEGNPERLAHITSGTGMGNKAVPGALDPPGVNSAEKEHESSTPIKSLSQFPREVTVLGACSNPEIKEAYIVAGTITKRRTGESKLVAIRINDRTKVIDQNGEPTPTSFVMTLEENRKIMVQGKQNKRGVINAKQISIL